eukprot:2086405-Rhodomonas_salina.5
MDTGTVLARFCLHGATRCPVLTWRLVLPGWPLAIEKAATSHLYRLICLRACYAMPGTNVASDATGLCNTQNRHTGGWYQARSTDIACAATGLRASYAMRGTDSAYGAMGLRAH